MAKGRPRKLFQKANKMICKNCNSIETREGDEFCEWCLDKQMQQRKKLAAEKDPIAARWRPPTYLAARSYLAYEMIEAHKELSAAVALRENNTLLPLATGDQPE